MNIFRFSVLVVWGFANLCSAQEPVNQAGHNGDAKAALIEAVKSGDIQEVRSCIERGADVSADGCAALHLAAQQDNDGMVNLMLDEGADIEGRAELDRTPLLSACAAGATKATLVLLLRGASLAAEDRNGSSPLQLAAEAGKVATAKALLDKGVDVKVADHRGNTALHYACEGNTSEIIDMLVARGADLAAKGYEGNTPLHWACKHGAKESVAALLAAGADVNAVNEDGKTPLSLAAMEDDAGMFRVMLEKGADPTIKDGEGETALHMAAQGGNLDILTILFSKNLEVDARDESGNTPLAVACEGESPAVVENLVAHGANVATRNAEGETLLHMAVGVRNSYQPNSAQKHLEIVAFLMGKGLDVNAVDNDANTPLHSACWAGNTETSCALMARGANVAAANRAGETPLWAAIGGGSCSVELIDTLLDKGADVNTSKKSGETPLHHACQHGRKDLVALLVARGALVNVKDAEGETPLHLACWDNAEIANFLLEHGADVNGADKKGRIPLHEVRTQAAVAALLTHGANIHAKDNDGLTPLLAALRAMVRKDHFPTIEEDVVPALLAAGADVNAAARDGGTPLHAACSLKNEKVVNELLARGARLCKDARGRTPVHIAAESGIPEIMRAVLDKVPDVNTLDERKRTPLHYASRAGNKAVFDMLMDRGAELSQDEDGNSPLHAAAESGFLEAIVVLLEKGADVEAVNKEGETSLCMAISGEPGKVIDITARFKAVSALLEKGSDPNTPTRRGRTALHEACYAQDREIVYALLSKGANPTSKTKSGYTPLHGAAAWGDTDVIVSFIDRGAPINAKGGLLQETPLLVAAIAGNEDAAKLLLEKGADPTACDRFANTLLHRAALGGSPELIDIALDAGIEIDAPTMEIGVRDLAEVYFAEDDGEASVSAGIDLIPLSISFGSVSLMLPPKWVERSGSMLRFGNNTPLHCAVAEGNTDAVSRLLAKGANVNARSSSGNLPLHFCAFREEEGEECAKLLIAQGSDVSACGWLGSPLHLAVMFENEDLVKLLLEHGAQVDAKDAWGATPVMFSDCEMMECLLSHGANIADVDTFGNTFLHYASCHDADAVVAGIGKGLDVNARNASLIYVSSPERVREIAYLVQTLDKFEEDEPNFKRFLKLFLKLLFRRARMPAPQNDMKGFTPLHSAVQLGDEESVRSLLDAGADANARDGRYGWSPLFLSLLSWDGWSEEGPLLLLERGADINSVDNEGWTPLHYAADVGLKDAVVWLSENGADITARNNRGRTPLDVAKRRGNSEIVALLSAN